MAGHDDDEILNALTVGEKAKVFDALYRTTGGKMGQEELFTLLLLDAVHDGDADLLSIILRLGVSANTHGPSDPADRILHLAAMMGHPHAVRVLLEHGASVDAVDGHRHTALHMAARHNHPRTAAVLLAAGASANFRSDHDGSTALEFAASRGFNNVIRTLVQHGEDVHAANTFGHTALHAAAEGNQVGTISVLLEAGADVDEQHEGELTPLHVASENNNPEFVRALHALGADLNRPDVSGATPLHCGILTPSPDAVSALLDAGADVRLRLGDERVRPYDAHMSALDLAAYAGNTEFVRELLEHGADVTATDPSGNTALHRAVSLSQVDTIEVLLRSGASVDARDSLGRTPLHHAAGRLAYEAVGALLGPGATSVEAVDTRGDTALHRAARASVNDSAFEIVDLLLAGHASENVANKDGRTPAQVLGADAGLNPSAHEPRSSPSVLDLLEGAAQDRADRVWGRRGFLLMCRLHPDRAPPNRPEGADGASRRDGGTATRKRAKSAGGEGGGRAGEGGAAGNNGGGGGRGTSRRGAAERASGSDVVARLVGIESEDAFRRIMKFL